MSISIQPVNQNLAQSTKFQLNFDRLPYITFFCSEVNIPGLSIGELPQPTPFIDLAVPGNKLSYETLDITFLVDEDYRSWQSVHDWIRGLAFPVDFTEYKNLPLQLRHQQAALLNTKEKLQYSDGSFTIFTNKNNPHIRVRFLDCFPLTLSSIHFSTEADADTIITAEATFKFSYFNIDRV